MRAIALVILLAGSAWGQALTEAAAAATGSTAGAVAGKKVSDGITNIFNKVNQTAEKSAANTKKAAGTLIEVGPGIPQAGGSAGAGVGAGSVPPPPPVKRAAARKPVPVPQPVEEPVAVPVPPPAPPPPPPPVVTTEDLKKVTTGMEREALLKLGQPAARITMFDDGHLVEIYRYMKRDTSLGFVTLSDGAVASVVVR